MWFNDWFSDWYAKWFGDGEPDERDAPPSMFIEMLGPKSFKKRKIDVINRENEEVMAIIEVFLKCQN